MMIENVVLVCLMLNYNKRPAAALSFMTIYVLCMLTLFVPVIPSGFLKGLSLLSIPVVSFSRVSQGDIAKESKGGTRPV